METNSQIENTLVIFLSDNGPWLSYGIDAGAAAPFRGGKTTVWEGGWRVPAIFNWPGHWPARQVDALVSLVDVLPTLAETIDIPLPDSYRPDGKSFRRLLTGQSDSTEGIFLYFADFSGKGATSGIGEQLLAIRQGSWKMLVTTHKSKRLGWLLGWRASPVALYDLNNDPGENFDIQQQHPNVVEELVILANRKLSEICEGIAPWASNSCE
jgi:arylsulfatase A